jgi:hypothetical protein
MEKLITIVAKREIKALKLSSSPNDKMHREFKDLMIHRQFNKHDLPHLMASSSTRNLIEGPYLTCFLMLGGEIMEVMTWASASRYEGNKKFQDGLSCKSFVDKKNLTHGSRQHKPFTRLQEVTIRKK